jgi:PIN domain nuclease of toxin-antitoxin system
MRYYLDTNIIAFFLFDKNLEENCDKNVCSLLSNYENIFYISSIAMRELIKLYNDGELKSIRYKSYEDLFSFVGELGVEIKPFTKQHVMAYAELEAVTDHKDPNDHMIIAQAVSEKIPVISSDKKFKLYENQGLQLVFNKR